MHGQLGDEVDPPSLQPNPRTDEIIDLLEQEEEETVAPAPAAASTQVIQPVSPASLVPAWSWSFIPVLNPTLAMPSCRAACRSA